MTTPNSMAPTSSIATNDTPIKKLRDEFWYDDLQGRIVNHETIEDVAKAVGGKVEGNFITVNGSHGEIVIRLGDFIGVDQIGKWHIVRVNYLDTNEELRAAVIERKKAFRSGGYAAR